ncbi:MAG: YncE family protein [Candidatus Solibacter sp.]
MRTLVPAVLVISGLLSAAETPALSLIVANKAENSLAIVDPSNGNVIARIPTGEGPHEVAVSADGKLAFVANNGSPQNPGSTLSVIDLVGQKEVRKFDISPLRRPHGLAVAGGKVYFTAEANRVVARYDSAANKIDWLTGTGQGQTHMVVAGKPEQVFTSNLGSDSITVIEGTAVTAIPVGQGPEAIDLAPDGKELWTAHSRDGGVSVIDVATKKVVATISLGTKRSNRLKFTPDGKRVLISDMSGGELIVLDAAARKEIQRIKIGTSPEGILMAKDGSVAYVCTSGDNRIAILDLKTLQVTGHLVTGKSPDGMAWSDRR